MLWKGLAVGIVLLFLVSVIPFIQGEPDDVADDSFAVQQDSYQYMMDWSVHLTNQTMSKETSGPSYNYVELGNIEPSPLSGPMDSAWPMRSHDMFRTGRSPYSTVENPLIEKWRFPADSWVFSGPVIDMNEIIYFGGGNFFAVYSNGTLKWVVDTGGLIESTPAIDENGIIYVGTVAGSPNHFYAFYTNGTVKFSYSSSDIFSSPVIGCDGVIYYGEYSYYINALYPNGP